MLKSTNQIPFSVVCFADKIRWPVSVTSESYFYSGIFLPSNFILTPDEFNFTSMELYLPAEEVYFDHIILIRPSNFILTPDEFNYRKILLQPPTNFTVRPLPWVCK